MADRLHSLLESQPGRFISKQVGLPTAAPLRRYEPGQALVDGAALVDGSPGARLIPTVERVLAGAGVELATHHTPDDEDERFGALIFDASGIESTERLREVYDFFHPTIRKVAASGRLIVLGTPPEQSASRRQAVTQRALEGFTRSIGKEVGGKGATVQLVYVAPGAEGNLESTLRFLASAKSAFVSGQVVRIGAGESGTVGDWEKPSAGRVAVVTGASRGIGASIARTLARDGAHVICLDVPAQGEDLADIANEIGGEAIQMDITDDAAPATLVEYLRERHGGVDVVVHNAGITRDKTLARMDEGQWDAVLAVNLTAQERINDGLLQDDSLREQGRIVSVSSFSGLAGNRGQANYATTKAGVIGTVESLAPLLAERKATINAVAPGFIETQMTAAMPAATREAGRRMNSLAQGGLPVDVAETIAWFASPASGGVNGNVVRVCGQGLIGA
ncbi:MAG: 3-oxoacyl-[acyl-carrier protein] reductase [Thermoleophilales bacterium]|nr:3-oxoacyl-[acyl-carrier protein] reductase [Thermoleophilales bacterium]